jgi:sugar O-acyltransferase (sialic acid O-acetyltransferase NeuD family)
MKIAIIGAGGHASEVYYALLDQQFVNNIAGFFVDQNYLDENRSFFYNIPIKSIKDLDNKKHKIHIAIGDLVHRANLYRYFKELGFKFETIIHPKAIVPKKMSNVGEGTYIAAGSIITTDVKIGNCVIINTGVILSHDCVIQNFCTISPGSILCGGVCIGELSQVGAGSLIREKILISENVILAMGSVVIKDIRESGRYLIQGSKIKRL